MAASNLIQDPSATICLEYDSLKEIPPTASEARLRDDWYVQSTPLNLLSTGKLSYQLIDGPGPKPEFCDGDRFEMLQQLKDRYGAEEFAQVRLMANPFEKIGKSIFMNRAAIKLANLDAVHRITGFDFTLSHPQDLDRRLVFCDVAAGPGGFTQYLQYRFPKSVGYGISLKYPEAENSLNWNRAQLDMNRFTIFDGPEGSPQTGDLYAYAESFVQFVHQRESERADIVLADGGIEVEDFADAGENIHSVYRKQEWLSSRLMLVQALIGLTATRVGGNFVLKVFDTVTAISAQILFVLANCFQRIQIFKPVTSRPANSERYVICKGRHPEEVIRINGHLFRVAFASYTNPGYFVSELFTQPLTPEFIAWLTRSNNESIEAQIVAGTTIISMLEQQPFPPIPKYNLQKFLLIWNLPDPPRPIRASSASSSSSYRGRKFRGGRQY